MSLARRGVGAAADAPPPPQAPAKRRRAQAAETRVVAFGDSDFASNGALGVPGNRDLFLNTVNWLAQQENLIAIRAARSARIGASR